MSDRNLVDEVRKCILTIESIYPSISMYDEPRDRLAFKINTLIQSVIERQERLIAEAPAMLDVLKVLAYPVMILDEIDARKKALEIIQRIEQA